ncbi:hypothetical protein VB002_02080 [Campylobacter concisus]
MPCSQTTQTDRINLNANFSGFDELKKLAGEAKFEIKNGLIDKGLAKLKTQLNLS